MYIKSLSVQNFKSFKGFFDWRFLHPGIKKQELETNFDTDTVHYDNINVILGNNASGKTAFLKAIALATLGPGVKDLDINPFMWVRRTPDTDQDSGFIDARFVSNEQDQIVFKRTESSIEVKIEDGLRDSISWVHVQRKDWHPVFDDDPAAMFLVGYGASRTVELPEKFDPTARKSSDKIRINKVRSLFEEQYQLVPLDAWLPKMKTNNRGRYVQILGLLSDITGDDHFHLTEEIRDDQYIFNRNGNEIPFNALSDGYRAFLGWVGDLLFHLELTCPPGKKLVENEGIVLIDEIDLHLHPAWQMKILPLLANALPKIQFFVTTHSPLVVGSIKWQNIIYLTSAEDNSSYPMRNKRNPYGLDTDQILVSDLFGLQSTRNDEVADRMRLLSFKASSGDSDARAELMKLMSEGGEL